MAGKEQGKTPRGGQRGIAARWGWVMVAVAVGAVLYFWGRAWLGGDDGAADPATIARGGAVYAQHCAECHGPQAAGQVPGLPQGGANPAGGYFAPALDGSGHAWHHPPDALFGIVKHGSPAADSPMKGFAGKLSDADIRAAIAWLQSLWPPEIRRRYFSTHGH